MKSLSIYQAHFWQKYYKVKNWLLITTSKHGAIIRWLILLLLLGATAFLLAPLHSVLDPYFSTQDRLDSFQTVLVTLGSALIGATAIAFSLVMFAMQVNVERMPHGLFRKFSSDLRLLAAFTLTFLLAIIVTTLSLIPDSAWVAPAALSAGWAIVLIIIFFLVAYRRALKLISPTEQLSLLLNDSKSNFEKWVKAAERASPLLRRQDAQEDDNATLRSEHDVERLTYFQLNPGWDATAQRSIAHCISFARRYAEQGDHEVSAFALNTILAINASYIQAKGKTFFCHNYMIDNPLATDGFVNDTLEHLRQNVQVGISRGDEQQIEQSLRALLGLCRVYLSIDYASEYKTYSHAHMAAGYLTQAVEAVVPHNMPDVLMEGIRLSGESARLILHHDKPEHIVSIAEKMALVACTGAVNEKYRPVTQEAVKQLANLTFELIRSESHDISYALGQVRGDVKLIAEIYLKIPDTHMGQLHSTSLGPYYSGTTNDALRSWLTELVNAVSNSAEDDEAAQRIIRHLSEWSGGLYQTEKDLLLLAIEKKSHFTFDIVHWIVHITKLLLAVSNTPACSDHDRDELRKNALWLISVLSFVPDDKDTVAFVENYQLTENLFEAAIDAQQRGCDDIALQVRDLLLLWAFKAGKYQTGWGTLDRACCALACFNIIANLDNTGLLQTIAERLEKEGAPSAELRSRAARGIRETADAYRHGRFAIRAIDAAMEEVDQDTLRALLHEVADCLEPETHESQS